MVVQGKIQAVAGAQTCTRTRTATILHAALLPLLALAFLLAAITHDAPEGDYQAMGPAAWEVFKESRNLDEPTNVPEWSWVAADFPSCSGATDVLADQVVVVDSGAESYRLGFDQAWAINHDGERANDVWVVGTC